MSASGCGCGCCTAHSAAMVAAVGEGLVLPGEAERVEGMEEVLRSASDVVEGYGVGGLPFWPEVEALSRALRAVRKGGR